MAPIRVAVLGTGFSAAIFHIPFIVALPDLYTLHTIYDRSMTPEKSRGREKWGHTGAKIVKNLDEVLGDPDVDLVIVTAKDPVHFEFAKAALSAGKHVVLEKPVCASSAEVRELISISKQNNVVFAPYHNRRFDGDFVTIKSLIQEGKLKDIVDFESRYDTRANWGIGAPGGSAGIIYGLGSHVIDQAVALFGQPKSVTALLDNGRKEGHLEVDDSFIVHLRYAETPVLVTLRAALHSVVSQQIRFIVRSKNDSFVKYGLDTQEPQAIQGMKPLDSGFGEDPESRYGEYSYLGPDWKPVVEKVRTIPGSYLNYYKNVAGAINGTGTLEVTPEHAELGIRIIEAAKVSSKEKRTVEM